MQSLTNSDQNIYIFVNKKDIVDNVYIEDPNRENIQIYFEDEDDDYLLVKNKLKRSGYYDLTK